MSHAPDTSMPHAGDILGGRYVLIERIGAGGMGRVFRARDEVLRREVAVKIFFADRTDDAEPLRRMSEARALAALDHPSLVTLYDAHLDAVDHVYLVMELITGPSLQRRIEEAPVSGTDVAGILSDLAGALAVVHDAGIVHRDVKPSNVLLRPVRGSERGFEAVLADFGVAHLVDATRLTTPGTVIGTAAYLAPEQVRGEPPRPASDVYALGLLAIEALTRLHPFGGGSLQETLLARLARQPEVPTTLGYAWRSLLVAMTANDPDARPTATEVAARAGALADGLETAVVETGPVTLVEPSPWAVLGLGDTGDAVPAAPETPTAVFVGSTVSPVDPGTAGGADAPVPTALPPSDADAAAARSVSLDAVRPRAAADASAPAGVDDADPLPVRPAPAASPAAAAIAQDPSEVAAARPGVDVGSTHAAVVRRRSRRGSRSASSRRRQRLWIIGAAAAGAVVVGVHVMSFAFGVGGDPSTTTVSVPDPSPSTSTPAPAASPVASTDDAVSNIEPVSTHDDDETTIAEQGLVDDTGVNPVPVNRAPAAVAPVPAPSSATGSASTKAKGTGASSDPAKAGAGATDAGNGNAEKGNAVEGDSGSGDAGNGPGAGAGSSSDGGAAVGGKGANGNGAGGKSAGGNGASDKGSNGKGSNGNGGGVKSTGAADTRSADGDAAPGKK